MLQCLFLQKLTLDTTNIKNNNVEKVHKQQLLYLNYSSIVLEKHVNELASL